MTTEVEIRRALPADAWAIAVCQTRCWEQTYRGFVRDDYLDRVGAQQRFQRWQQRVDDGREVWVAQARHPAASDSTDLVGVASAGPSRDVAVVRERELMSLYTLGSTHGSGVGQRLLDAAIGTEPASLWVFAGNDRAIAFYRRNRFVPDGVGKFDDVVGVDEIRMVR